MTKSTVLASGVESQTDWNRGRSVRSNAQFALASARIQDRSDYAAPIGAAPALAVVAQAAWPHGQLVTVCPLSSSHLGLQYLLPSAALQLHAGWAHFRCWLLGILPPETTRGTYHASERRVAILRELIPRLQFAPVHSRLIFVYQKLAICPA